MENNLKKITDKTLNKLVQNQIILPSVYFKTFNESAEELNIDVFDDNFKIEIDKILDDEYEKITSFMDKTIYSIDTLSQATNEAHNAIKSNDVSKLEKISQNMVNIKHELLNMKKLIFVDEMTNTLNRKWIYTRALDENANFKDSGTIALIFINDYFSIIKKHSQSIADNILIFIAKFLTKEFHKREINVDIAKYSDNKFLIFYKDGDFNEFQDILKKIKEGILKSTLQTKSGVTLKTKFDFTQEIFNKGNSFQNILDLLIDKERG